jgi:2-polyprenyl-3-methyl-5-hydroxy-6-metoxy-1,4-benzoquinol methylase
LPRIALPICGILRNPYVFRFRRDGHGNKDRSIAHSIFIRLSIHAKLTETGMNKRNSGSSKIADRERESTACPYCKGEASLLVSSTDKNRGTTHFSFRYYQCQFCHLVFMYPIPEDMRPFYKGGYQKIPRNLSELRAIAKTEQYRMEPILKYKSGGKLLEIGPWIGIFSCNANDAGFEVTAIDIDQECVDFLSKVAGVRALQSSDPAETLAQMDEKFDVIALWHCLEHLPTPWLVIQRAAERLAPGGVLLIAIPNIESYEFSLLKESWQHLDAPRHLYFYPVQSLLELCSANGLVSLEVTTRDKLSQLLSRGAWHAWASSKVPVRYLRGAVGLLLHAIVWQTRRSRNSGSGLTALFRSQPYRPNSDQRANVEIMVER